MITKKIHITLYSLPLLIFVILFSFEKYNNYKSLLIEYYLVIYLLPEEDCNSTTSVALRNRSYTIINESRSSYLGKIISDKIESQFPKYRESRINFNKSEETHSIKN